MHVVIVNVQSGQPATQVWVPVNENTKNGTEMIQPDNRLVITIPGAIVTAVIVVGTFLIGLAIVSIFLDALRSASHSSSGHLHHHHHRTDSRISAVLCPTNQSLECPDHLKNIIAVLNTCSLIDDDDLTYRVMRINVDQAILRETVLHNPLRNGNNTPNNVTNTIM